MLPKSLRQASSILSSLVVTLLTIDKIFYASEAYLASHELIFLISAVSLLLFLPSSTVKEELTLERRVESSLVILVLISIVSLLKIFLIFSVYFFVLRLLTILVIRAENLSEIFYLRFDHMVVILMNNTGPINKKTVVKVKKGMTSEGLNNDKLDMIR